MTTKTMFERQMDIEYKEFIAKTKHLSIEEAFLEGYIRGWQNGNRTRTI